MWPAAKLSAPTRVLWFTVGWLSAWVDAGGVLGWFEPFIAGLLFATIGGIIGSFLNVVAHRVPRGGSVWGGRSRCPVCGRPIRAADNIPVVSWIALRGRCRDCHAAIPTRYPFVEAAMALATLLLAFGELRTNGANLPEGTIPAARLAGPDLPFVQLASWTVCGLFAWHVVMLAVLLTWTLFALDRYRPSCRGIVLTVAVVVAAGAVIPWLAPIGIAAGVAVGCAEGWLERLISRLNGAGKASSSEGGWYRPAAMALVGGVVGWQGLLGVAAIHTGLLGLALVLSRVVSPRRSGRLPPAPLTLPVAAVIFLLAWRPLAGFAARFF